MTGTILNLRGAIGRLTVTCLTAGFLFAAILTAQAQDKKDDDRMDKAWDAASALQEGLLDDALQAMLNNMAYQAAVTNVCDGFTLDVRKFSKAFSALQDRAADEQEADFSEDEIRDWNTAMAVKLGLATGLFIAEGHAAPEDFCANAAELKSETDVPSYWE